MIVEQINNGSIGVILTAIVTVLLLGQQSQSEELREKNSTVFAKKLEVYHEFISSLESIIQDGKLSTANKDNEKDELTSLLFKLAQVRMHTGEEKVLQILQSVADISNNLNDKTASSINHLQLADSLFTTVNTLRWELYPEKEQSEKSTADTVFKNDKDVKKHIKSIVDSANWATDVEENKKVASLSTELISLSPQSRNEMISLFEDKIVAELSDQLTNIEGWNIISEHSDRIHLTVRNNSWVGDSKIGLYDYPDADRLCFAAWYNGNGYYKDVYLVARRDLSGRFNRYNWWLNLKEPYNKWDENSVGLLAVKENDEELIRYITESLVRVAKRFNEIIPTYENICNLKNGIEISENVTQGIYEAYSLIHIIDLNGYQIGSDTFIDDDNKWKLHLYGRNDASQTYLQKEILKSEHFAVPLKLTEDNERFIYHQYDSDVDIATVRSSLQELLNKLESFAQLK